MVLLVACALRVHWTTYTIEEAVAYQGQQAVFKWHNLSLLTAMLTSGNVFKVYKIVLLCDNSLLDYVSLCHTGECVLVCITNGFWTIIVPE